ncbi:hypothetical protein, partial [uncultured Rhodoferax sp.]|uniref:hypothetical protein n=1 Tax=uncultured Rhodoferax sp. TaxID=223188 RepID=UPI0025D68358
RSRIAYVRQQLLVQRCPKEHKKSTGVSGAFAKLHRGVQGLLLVLAVSSASFQAWSLQTSQLLSGLRWHAM